MLTLSHLQEVSNDKTQRLKVNQYDTLYLLSTNMDESNMLKENIIKEMF